MSGGVLRPPVVRLRAGGVALPAGVLAGLTRVVVHQRLGQPAQLQFSATGAAAEELSQLATGDVEIVVQVEGHDVDLFVGALAGIEDRWDRHGHRSVVVRANDALHELRRERRTAAYLERSAIDLAEELCGEAGLVVQSDRAVTVHESLHQVGRTDLGFLRQILASHGLQLTLRGDTVHLVDRTGVGATIELRPGEELLELSIDRRTSDPEPASVVGWHAGRAAGVATGSDHPLVGWTIDDDLAADLATAVTERSARLVTVARGVAVGDTALRPGTPVDLPGSGALGGLFGREELVVTDAVHRITATEGYVTEFSTESVDEVPTVPPATLTLGVVVDVDDPDGRGRVQVELPAYGDLATWWMPVVCAGAGDDVGIVALPDAGATVAVVGPLDQPGRGVVLGGLFGESTPPGEPVDGGRSRRFAARLPGGACLLLDAAGSRVLVENGEGSRVEMTPDAVTVHAAADLEIAAPGHHLLFRADRIDFERA